MRSQMANELFELAKAAVDTTERGTLPWRRTNDNPREYYASLGNESAIAIRKVALRRSDTPQERPPRIGGLAAQIIAPPRESPLADDYVLTLISPTSGELISVSSEDYDLVSWERDLLAGLFQAAVVAAEHVHEVVDDAMKALLETP